MSDAGEATKTGTLIGSPHYMSPEQAKGGKNLDYRSDLWSLGGIIFRMITGRLPFPGDELGEVIVAICAEPSPIPSPLAPDLGPDVDHCSARAPARDPSRRSKSAKEMADAFAALAGAAPGSSLVQYNPALMNAAAAQPPVPPSGTVAMPAGSMQAGYMQAGYP